MSDHEHSMDEAVAAALESLRNPLVTMVEPGVFAFRDPSGVIPWLYEFDVSSMGDALRWIEHMAPKTWVTTAHLEQFASLAATHFGQGYR